MSIPIGGIVYWAGDLGDLPSGFVLCDGTGGTPDLRDQFVYGAGGDAAVGDTGGSAILILPTHDHDAATTVLESISATFNYQTAHWHESTDDGGYRTTDTDGASTIGGGAGIFVEGVETGADHFHIFYVATDSSDLFYTYYQPGGEAGHGDLVNHRHTGSGTYDDADDSDAANQLPPYYALAFIQRVS